MAEVNSAQSAKIAAGTKLSTNEQGAVHCANITMPATYAQVAIADTVATGVYLPKGARILNVLKQHGTGTASSTLDVGLRKRDGTVIDMDGICEVTALTTATTTAVECGNGALIDAGIDYVLADEAEIYFTARGAVIAANQDIRLSIFYTAG
jgi:hypothetical protein